MYAEDLKEIFGPRQWRSRTEEIMRLQAERDAARDAEKSKEQPEGAEPTTENHGEVGNEPEDVEAVEVVEATEVEVNDPAASGNDAHGDTDIKDGDKNDVTPPPFKGV